MLFNSFVYLIFFPTVFALYFTIPHRFRTLLLLVASCVFYMWLVPWYIFVLLFLILVDYSAALLMEGASGRKRKAYLIASIVASLLTLFVFKYYDFFNSLAAGFFSLFGVGYSAASLGLLLPIGLSFHTFQSLSYVFEVYAGRHKAERSLLTYATYVMFFPQLVAGPIERPQHLLPQFKEEHMIRYSNVSSGLRLILWGLFKKVVIADRLALAVNYVFDKPMSQSGLAILFAVAFFTIEIYLDFSGYTDIARGSARCLGFELMVNFKRPFMATSIADFWKRWHISLTSWFKDYVYIPLGGNRITSFRTHANLIFVFLLSGLWHGAGMHYVMWGFLNGTYISIQRLFDHSAGAMRAVYDRAAMLTPAFAKRLFVFALASLSLLYFRSDSVAEGTRILIRMIERIPADSVRAWNSLFTSDSITEWLFPSVSIHLPAACALIACFFAIEWVMEFPERKYPSFILRVFETRRPVRWTAYYVLLLAIVSYGIHDHVPFIYFQF